MKRSLLLPCAILATAILSSCVSGEKVELGGAPGWIAGGAKIEDEPEPVAPDPAVLPFFEEGGPVELKIITDKRNYEEGNTRDRDLSPSARHDSDLIEPGRDRRINRLFR